MQNPDNRQRGIMSAKEELCFSENSRRLWLFLGSVRELWRKVPGKSRENCWKNFPESRNATNYRISVTGKGKPAGNLGSTLPGACRHLPCGVFLKSTVPAFSSFSELLEVCTKVLSRIGPSQSVSKEKHPHMKQAEGV